MFRYFNQFGEPNELDVLLCDEAHRIRETSANRYTKASARTGAPQVDELLQVARVPVFLLDEHQVVRPGERGSLREIQLAAARSFCPLHARLAGACRSLGRHVILYYERPEIVGVPEEPNHAERQTLRACNGLLGCRNRPSRWSSIPSSGATRPLVERPLLPMSGSFAGL